MALKGREILYACNGEERNDPCECRMAGALRGKSIRGFRLSSGLI